MIKTQQEKNREEAEEMLRNIGMYKAMMPEQIFALHPGYDRKTTHNVIVRLVYQQRMYFDQEHGCFRDVKTSKRIDEGMIKALWVLIDRLKRAGSHTAGSKLVKLCFEEDGCIYHVLHCKPGMEQKISDFVFKMMEEQDFCVVILENEEQMGKFPVDPVVEYCTVAWDGAVSYY